MPEASEVEETIHELVEFHRELQYEVEEEINQVVSDGEVIYQYFHRNRPAWDVSIWGTDQREYMAFEYHYDLLSDVASALTEEQVEEWADPMEDVDDVPQSTYAATNILGAIDPETRAEIRYQLSNQLLDDQTWGEVKSGFGVEFSGFRAIRRVFPYEDKFGLKEYEENFAPLMNAGLRSHRFLRFTLNLDSSGEGVSIPHMVDESE